MERRGGPATDVKSSSATLPAPKEVSPTPQVTERPLNTVGLRRGSPMVHKGSSPPAARLGRRAGSPPIKGSSPMAEQGQSLGQSLPVSREQSPTPAPKRLASAESVQQERMSLPLDSVPQQGRPRSRTDVGAHPPYAQIARSTSPEQADFRPPVPQKDAVKYTPPPDHDRSRSLSPSANRREKPEKKRNVFGLFPERKEKERNDSESKRGVANQIAAVFHRKVSSQSVPQQDSSPVLSTKSTPTPQMNALYNTPPFGLSPPQPWMNSATTPPINQLSWNSKNTTSSNASPVINSLKLRQTPRHQHSRDNSSSTNATTYSHSHKPSSGLANQASFDMDEAIEKVWGAIQATSKTPPVHGDSPDIVSPHNNRRTRNRTPQQPFSRQFSEEWPKPSPLLPPVNKQAYQKRTLPPAPNPAPALISRKSTPSSEKPASFEIEQNKVIEEDTNLPPVSPLLPVAYNPNESTPASPTSPLFEPLLPIAMIPATPHRLSSRVSHRLSVSIPPIGRPVTQSFSAPSTPAEFYKATTSATHEKRFFLELPTGLGEFHLDSAIEAQQEDEDDILVWLDSLKFEKFEEEQFKAGQNIVPEEAGIVPEGLQVMVDAASPILETSLAPSVDIVRPRSPSFIPRKPVSSSAKITTPPTPPAANNLLSPPVPQLSPPTPSDYSGAFSRRISYTSSVGDSFKYDLRYTEELPNFDWRSSGELSECGGLGLQNVSSEPSSSVSSSPQTQPSITFSSPNLSDCSTTSPSASDLGRSDINAILGPSKVGATSRVDVYIPDDSASEGMLSAEIENILRAQMQADEELFAKKQTMEEKEREDMMELEYLRRIQARRTRYVRGRNSEFEGDILFILKSEDII